jgi:glycosyltransferase involved in cell wall biosynthesis
MVRFLIVTTGYNCEKYVKPCFDSIKSQTYHNYDVTAFDDGSTDGTAKAMIAEAPKTWRVQGWKQNKGTYFARDYAIREATDDYIIALLDMDDQLRPNALELVAREYEKNPNLLMTYGNYQFNNGLVCPIDLEYIPPVHRQRQYRRDTFRCTHLRTFKKDLYNAVPRWDLTKAEVDSYPDAHLLFCMMEMSGKERMKIIKEPIYVYNTHNPLNTLRRFGKDDDGYKEITKRPKMNLL